MTEPAPQKGTRNAERATAARWRCYFRRLRIAALLGLLGLIGVLIYLNLIGLPAFARRPLLDALRERGLDFSVANLRWHYFRGIVAEQVKFGWATEEAGPRFTATEAELNLDYRALLQRRLEISSVGLREGRVSLPVGGSNQPTRLLSIGNIRTELRLLPEDTWSLEDFQASFAGADFFLRGVVTNASAVRNWPGLRPPVRRSGEPERVDDGTARRRLLKLADVLEKVRFSRTPQLRGTFRGDARDLESFALLLTISAPDGDTPWGNFAEGALTLRLRPAAPIERPQVDVRFEAASVQTRWAEVLQPQLDLRLVGGESDTNRVHAQLSARADVVSTRWVTVTNAVFNASWEHALTNAIPIAGQGDLLADSAVTRWIGARDVMMKATLGPRTSPPPADAALGEWQVVWPYALGFWVHARRCDTEKLDAEEIRLGGHWAAPRLELTNVLARFAEGRLEGRANLDAQTREAAFELTSDFDPDKARPFLSEKANRWLDRFGWTQPPLISGQGAVVLPAWSELGTRSSELGAPGAVDWREEVLPSLRLAAFVRATNASYLKLPADWVQTHISLTNQVWWLPDLVAGRPEGLLHLAHRADDKSRDYWFGFHSTIDPAVVRPLLSTNAQKGLDFFRFSAPPSVVGGIWGRWRQPELIGFTGRVQVAEFDFREQHVSQLSTGLRFTNRFLECLDPVLVRGTEAGSGPGIAADFVAERVYFTNISSSLDPLFVTRCIGPKTTEVIAPYVFRAPPKGVVNGFVPLGRNHEADAVFDLDGGPFEWQKFHIPRIAGRVHWTTAGLGLSNILLHAYGGTGAGRASFDLQPGTGTPFEFALGVTNVDLKLLLADLVTQTNQLDGRLNGLLVVTKANANDPFSWFGYGHASLREGWIWELPIFGVLSKPLNSVVPGLGSTKFSEGSATFIITNGVIVSDDLEMRAPNSRLQYVGTVDFATRVDARVRAEPMRDTVLIGPVLNLALWPVSKLLEYKITGTLGEPKPEPLHIPKLIYKPLFHPFRLLEDLFTADPPATNRQSPSPPSTPLSPKSGSGEGGEGQSIPPKFSPPPEP